MTMPNPPARLPVQLPRERHQRFEDLSLAPYALKASRTRGRRYAEAGDPDPYRTPFQRDRDRVLYCDAFRRLAYKTQVYVVHEGDFYRTRLTHTLEVMQQARTLARALGLNEDLAEAIAYAHDLGHSPFGHSGEDELNRLMVGHGGFDHNLQGLRLVDELERRTVDYSGLNLTYETREGIARHSTPYDSADVPEEFSIYPNPSMEAQAVNVADVIAFSTHDLADALRAGLICRAEILEAVGAALGGAAGGPGCPAPGAVGDHELVRNLLSSLTISVISHTEANILRLGIQSADDARGCGEAVVAFEPEMGEVLARLRTTLETKVYSSHAVVIMTEKGRMIIRRLFEALISEPGLLPPAVKAAFFARGPEDQGGRRRVVCDFLCQMTDRTAMDYYDALFEPYARVFRGFTDAR